MPFKPGNKYGKGRPQNALNKLSAGDKEALHEIFRNDLLPTFKKDIKELSAKDRVQATLKLAEFYIPKLRSIDLSIDVDSMTEEQAAWFIDLLKESLKKGEQTERIIKENPGRESKQ